MEGKSDGEKWDRTKLGLIACYCSDSHRVGETVKYNRHNCDGDKRKIEKDTVTGAKRSATFPT